MIELALAVRWERAAAAVHIQAEARRRLSAQVDNATREARCDEIIHNTGDLKSLRQEVISLKVRLDHRFGGP